MSGALAVLSMGLVLGFQHATDADHVAAVSTIVADQRRVGAAARVGVAWGLGHSTTVVLAGGAMVASGVVLPERAAQSLEMVVAAMLIVLGVTGARRALSALSLHRAQASAAGGEAARGPGHAHGALPRTWWRPFGVGVVHGLAGSAALALAVLATVADRSLAIAYLGLFCLGTVIGMSLVTAAMAAPVLVAARRLRADLPMRAAVAAGVLSIACGAWLGYRVGIVEGLLLGVARAALP